jgi:hypothetical protein
MPFPLLIPLAIGAGLGALTNRKNPLAGAAMGGTLGAVTGGLGGLGGAAGGAMPSAVAGAAPMTTYSLAPLAQGGAALPMSAPGLSLADAGMATGTMPATGGLLSPGGLDSMGKIAGMAAQAGVFNGQGPQAQSAGIPARPADFTGLLAQHPQISGAQILMAQRRARMGG